MKKDVLQELKEQKIWVIYKKVKNEKGRTDKKPYAVNGKMSGSNETYKESWVTYEEAVDAVKKNKADGVGFVLQEGYFFLDIDDQELQSPVVQEIVKQFSSYTELSPSRKGVHIYGKCSTSRVPTKWDAKKKISKLSDEYYTKNSESGFELYIGGLTNRFATFTGDVVEELPLRECSEEIVDFLDKHMRRAKEEKKAETTEEKKKKPRNRKEAVESVSDIALALGRQANGEKFRKLFFEGDIDGYPSQSEAEQGLCEIIAFRNDDEEVIDAVFRQSALFEQEKWERRGKNTIEKAIVEARKHKEEEIAQARRNKMRPSFVLVDKNKDEYISTPLLVRHMKDYVPYIFVKDDANQTTRKYVYENGCYRLYDDDMFKAVIIEEIEKYDVHLVRNKQIDEVLKLLKAQRYFMNTTDLNSNQNIINFQNGLLEVSADKLVLKEHTSKEYSTIQIPCKWDGCDYETPVFDAYMDTLTSGNKDIQKLLLQFLGVALSNVAGYRMKKSLFMVGKGDSGKSQLKALAERLLGNGNFAAIDLSDIEARFGTSKVYGKRLVGSADMGFMSINELRAFKQLTGGDNIHAEYKNQNSFSFVFNGVLWFCMNQLPKFGGDQGQWVYDRIMVVRCDNSIPLEKQDKELLNKMYAERAGIIYKAVKALQTVIANGYRYDEPDCVKDGRDDYQKSNSTVISFFEECMQKEKTCSGDYSTGRIFDAYKKWCKDNNNGYYDTAKEFRDALCQYLGKSYGDITRRVNGKTYYREYYVTAEAEFQYLM